MGRIVARHHSSVGELTNKDPYEESDKDEKTVGRLSTIHSRNNTKIGRLWHSRLVRFEIKKEEEKGVFYLDLFRSILKATTILFRTMSSRKLFAQRYSDRHDPHLNWHVQNSASQFVFWPILPRQNG